MTADAVPTIVERDPKTTDYTEFLLHSLQERLQLLQALKSLADSQSQAARHGDVEVTLGLLARKQSLLDELGLLQQRLRPYFSDEPEHRVWRTPERRALCQEISAAGTQLLQQTMQLEQATLDEMSGRRDAVAAQLQNGKDSILAHTAYTADNFLNSSALDIGDL